jgi:Flp pilus assembly protein TadG
MFRVLRSAVRRFRRDERGNVFILFGASAIPLMLIMGGAVDIARYARYKVELANAVDAAALALARQHDDYNDSQATTFVSNYVNALNVADGNRFTISNLAVTKLTNGFHVTVTGTMPTIFLPLGNFTKSGGGLSSLSTNLVAEVVNSSNRLEVALVFDNTGSMNCGNSMSGCDVNDWATPPSSSRIVALKAAANTLLDILMPDGDPSLYEFIKIGIVPFEGAVNTGYNSNNVPSWVEWNNEASAKYNGQNFGKYNFVTSSACSSGANCKFVGHKWLYGKLTTNDSNVKWEGCVEMRAEPYDILDTTPTSATPDTMFVPYLWPDEPDSDNDDGDNYENNYLNDRTTSNGSAAQKNIGKFTNIGWQSGTKDTTFPYEHGPNFGCPRPIVPLTNNKTTLETAVTNLVAYYSTGTFIPVGLVWGWHILTPNEPFTQGIGPSDEHYDQTVKAIVLFTDGENYITGTNNHNDSRFSAYNYINQIAGVYRLDDDNTSDAMDALDTKTATLCENVKTNSTAGTTDDDIRLYTITFGDMTQADEDLMEDCATVDDDGEPLYYHAPTTDDLEDIFQQIGEDLSEIHLAM